MTSYSHYESQRGSTLRSTQITTFFDALALPFFPLPLCLSLYFAVPLFFAHSPRDEPPLQKLHLDKDKEYSRHTCTHRQPHCCRPELHLRAGIMSADQGLGGSQSSLAANFTKISIHSKVPGQKRPAPAAFNKAACLYVHQTEEAGASRGCLVRRNVMFLADALLATRHLLQILITLGLMFSMWKRAVKNR